MSNFTKFMKKNKVVAENVTFAATTSLFEDDGTPLLWELRPLTTRENDTIRDSCTKDIPVKGKAGQYRSKLDTSKYIAKMICESVVTPSLYDKELQDSYGVMTPEDLLREMVNKPGEYSDFATFVQELNGFTTLEEEIDEVKN